MFLSLGSLVNTKQNVINMSIRIHKAKSLNKNRETRIHYMPCKIHADTDAKVKEYFETSISKDANENLSASFRGYPLKGSEFNIPTGYKGIVLHESIRPLTEDENRRFRTTHEFDSFYYWNWDTVPSENDEFAQAFDWIDVSEALHEPITLKDMKKS